MANSHSISLALSILAFTSHVGRGFAAPVATASSLSPLLGYSPSNTLVNENTNNIQYSLAPGQTADANIGAYLDFENIANPQPIRGTKGGTDPGPRASEYDRINSDKLAPPGTDHGDVANAQWPMGLSHAKLGQSSAGWSRQQNVGVLPAAAAMAGVDMRLEPGAYRELHWHKAAEWARVLNGTVRIQAIDENGRTFVDDLSKGDVWFFPAGIPHSLQGLGGGCEFLLVFDDGSFSEDNTFLASEVFAHNPKEVLSKNLNLNLSAFDNIPPNELFIFPGTPAPTDITKQNVTGTAGIIPQASSFSYHFSEQKAMEVAGGSVKIIDPTNFPIAAKFSAALVTVKLGAIREIHWHTTSDEWNFFLAGKTRISVFAAEGNARTFDYRAGDCGYIPKAMTHYVENVGTEDVVFVEVLQADHFSDIALGQWLALTPKQIVQDTLHLSNATLASLSKAKQYIVQGPVAATTAAISPNVTSTTTTKPSTAKPSTSTVKAISTTTKA